MEIWTAELQHTEETIRALCRAQFRAANRMRVLAGYAACTLCLVVGAFLTASGGGAAIALIMLGCWALVAVNQTPERRAKRVIASLHGKYPHVNYSFSEREFNADFGNNVDTIAYSDVTRLMEDKTYCYFLLRSSAVYLFSKSSAGDLEALKKVIAQHVGLGWTANRGFATFSLGQILAEWKNTRR